MLNIGIEGFAERIAAKEDTAENRKSGTLNVFATPAMIELIEETAWKSVAKELDEGSTSVGTNLNVRHLSATPVGMKITCKTKLVETDGRRLVFDVEVFDEAGKVGEGTHERFIVQSEKFQKKADGKLQKTV